MASIYIKGQDDIELQNIKGEVIRLLIGLPVSSAKGILTRALEELDFVSIVEEKLLSKREHDDAELTSNLLKGN